MPLMSRYFVFSYYRSPPWSDSAPALSESRVFRPKRRIGDPRKEPLRNWTILVERGGFATGSVCSLAVTAVKTNFRFGRRTGRNEQPIHDLNYLGSPMRRRRSRKRGSP